MNRRAYPLVAVATVTLVLLSGTAGGASPDGDYGPGRVRARLVADTAEVKTGSSFHLGVAFEIEPGWHIYWRNPGGAGLATDVRWRLPVGFEAGDLRWPLPIAFTQAEDIPGYGYQGSVVLASEVRVEGTATADAEIGATVSWLACKDVCVLGSAELTAPLATLPFDGEVFDGWSENLPRSVDSGASPFSVATTGDVGDGHLVLWLRWAKEPPRVEWFPDPSEELKVENVAVRTRGALTRIDAEVRRLESPSGSPATLKSLVVETNAEGRRRGWGLAVDLENEEP